MPSPKSSSSSAAKAKGGRPPARGSTASRVVVFRVTEAEHDAIHRAAEDRGATVTDYLLGLHERAHEDFLRGFEAGVEKGRAG